MSEGVPDHRGEGWETMLQVLARVAVGPEGSRDLSEDEAHDALALCLRREASDVQIACFLLAERLKRETEAENLGFLRALVEASVVVHGPAPAVVSLADPYDGFTRTPHFAPVVAAVLGAAGLPAYVHGVETAPPKEGVTARQVMRAFGIPIDRELGRGRASVESAASRLAEVGCAYVALEDFCPSLAALAEVRREMAKRPCLATLEKLVTPLRGRDATHVVSGWVHAGYDELMTSLLRRLGTTSVLLVKGREGHVDPFVHAETEFYGYRPGDAAATRTTLDPKGLGCLIAGRPDWPDPTPGNVADLWESVFSRKRRTAPGQIVRLLAGAALHQAGVVPTVMRGVGLAHDALASGKARAVLVAMGGGG